MTGPWRLVVCDMDGTLVKETTALAHLGTWCGRHVPVEDLEDRLARGAVTDRDVAEEHALAYRGLALADAMAAMETIAGIDDIATGVQMLRELSIEAVIATVSWSFAGRALADLWGFSGASGADLEVDPASGRFTGRVARHFAPEDKVAFVAELCRRGGFGMEQVVAIGDSRSDLPLFEAAGFSVALNATSDARAAASTSVDAPSLLEALRAVPGLVAAA